MEDKTKTTSSAGGVVLNEKGEVLVVNQNGTSWSLPKGHLEDGESNLDAAKREIYEESGINKLEFIEKLGNYQRYKIGKDGKEDKLEKKTIHMFLFKTKEEKLNPIDPENPTALWLNKEKVVEQLSHPKDKEFFREITKEIL